MHQLRSTTLVALPDVTTLDPERTDQVGTFLTIEAAADVAATASGRARPSGSPVPRRVVGGIAAALVLGGVLFAANGIVGGPGPAAVPAAVAIEHADGWTTIEILDPQASPTQIEAALDAAGIDARVEADQTPLTSTPPGSGPPLRWRASGSTSYSVATYGSVGPGELSGLKVEFPAGTVIALPTMIPPLGPDQPTNEAEIEAWDDAYRGSLEPIGIRISGPDDTIVSVRDGSAVTIVLSTPLDEAVACQPAWPRLTLVVVGAVGVVGATWSTRVTDHYLTWPVAETSAVMRTVS